MKRLRVGIIGASAEGGWARDGHVPAVRGLAGLEFAAVATSNQKSAEASANAFGVTSAFGSGLDLIRKGDVDLVTIATRVPDHRELVLAALDAGKHVYCEWPLGRGVAEAEEMAAAARAAGVHAAIGLQLRGSPAVRKARELIASGAIGRILSARVSTSTAGFGPVVPPPYLYLENPENFANLITIQGAHTIDMAVFVVGALADIDALTTRQYPEIEAGDGHEKRPRTTFDHLLLQSRLAGGGALSIEVAGGRPPETPSSLEVVGDSGTIRLDGGDARGVQAGRLMLSVNGHRLRVDEGELAAMPDAAVNVAGLYAALRDDIAYDTATIPDFEHAARLTHLVNDILDSPQGDAKSSMSKSPKAS